MAAFNSELKALIRVRDSGACVRCGVQALNGEVHHRRARGMGGRDSHEEWINHPSNLILLCSSCHRWIETHREESRERGWLVGPGEVPEDVHVQSWEGVVYRLHGDDFKTPVGTCSTPWMK